MIETPLFESPNVRLTGFDIDADVEVLSAWSYDLEVARQLREGLVHPLNLADTKKFIEEKQKEGDSTGRVFIFGARKKNGDGLAGVLLIQAFDWTHGAGRLSVFSGESEQRSIILAETLQLGLSYVFHELNLFRVEVIVPSYDYAGIELYEGSGFQLEARQREFFFRAGHYWDSLHYGLLCTEWSQPLTGVEDGR
jgi:RimJ/RimL family protein N-acetyltransferase